MLYRQTYNPGQVGFAGDGLKDALQTGCLYLYHYECDEGCQQGAQGDDQNCQEDMDRKRKIAAMLWELCSDISNRIGTFIEE